MVDTKNVCLLIIAQNIYQRIHRFVEEYLTNSTNSIKQTQRQKHMYTTVKSP